mmetsp:Transcript_31777/g.37054  ORF Transcript_31777/g.37054 Transcript_31777/m.37054 type:complete len:108 (-) Transcript_31777:1295-1618(-)
MTSATKVVTFLILFLHVLTIQFNPCHAFSGVTPPGPPTRSKETPISNWNQPYVQSEYSRPLPENAKYTHERISQLVLERTQYKQEQNFRKANAIRDALEKGSKQRRH